MQKTFDRWKSSVIGYRWKAFVIGYNDILQQKNRSKRKWTMPAIKQNDIKTEKVKMKKQQTLSEVGGFLLSASEKAERNRSN